MEFLFKIDAETSSKQRMKRVILNWFQDVIPIVFQIDTIKYSHI